MWYTSIVAIHDAEYDILWQMVLDQPLEPGPKLILANWLLDRDLDIPLALGLRYCADNGRWPQEYRINDYSAYWSWSRTPYARITSRGFLDAPHTLERSFLNKIMKASKTHWSDFYTASQAITLIRRLGRGIAAL